MNRPSPLRALMACSALGAVLLAGCTDTQEPVEPTGATGDATAETGDAAAETGDAAAETGEAAVQSADAAEQTGDVAAETVEPVTVTSADGTFTITAPQGWEDVADTVEDDFQLVLRDQSMRDDFFANIIVAQDEPIADMEEAIEQSAIDLSGARGEYTMRQPLDLDGEQALGYAVTLPHDDGDRFFIQRWVERDDRLYLITLTAIASRQGTGTTALAEVLDSWTWQD